MASIKLETNDLTACAQKYKTIADDFNKNCNSVLSKISEYDNVWKGTFTQDLDSKVDKLKSVQNSIYTNCLDLVDFINKAVEQYIKVDKGLAAQSTIGTADYPDNVKVSVHVKSSQELQDIYNASKQKANNMTKNVDGSISCASLTKAKAEANGFNADWNGNGNQVYNNISAGEHSNYAATKYAGGNCLQDLIKAEGEPITDIVISFPKSPSYGTKYGHVLYIDQIVDGKVYFSDNIAPTTGKVLTIDQFLKNYANSNGTPIGCVHLKKK
ncbi:MAG: hypothetical protein J1E81_00475 [Eubacterium sp.]|nr:hypothetical protein [Eubacterium sp.]